MKLNIDTEEYKNLIELHAHTSPASDCARHKAEELIKGYAELGFNGIAITNHFFPNGTINEAEKIINDYHEALECADKYNMKIFLGVEIRFWSESNNDYLVFGIDEEFIKAVTMSYPKNLAEFYTNFKNDNNLIIQAHPMRSGMVRMPKKFLDGIEAFNLHYNHNSKVALAARYVAENGFEIATRKTLLPESS